MIDEKKIKEASKAYYRKTQAKCSEIRDDEFEATGKDPGLFYVCADVSFMNGVEWAQREFVKSLWHSAEEEPQRYDDYLVKTIQGCIDSCFFDMNGWHEPKIGGGQVCQWLDLSDILPKSKEK